MRSFVTILIALVCGACSSMQSHTNASSETRDALVSKMEIAELVNSWGYFRDQGRWAELLDAFHPEGAISVSWYDGPYREFVSQSRQLAEAHRDMVIKHQVAIPLIKVKGNRGLSEASVTISVRSRTPGGTFEQTSYARFIDRVERRDGRWRILRRDTVYERDRLDAVDQSTLPQSFYENLDRYPAQVMFLASTIKRRGAEISKSTLLAGTAQVARVYSDNDVWLSGD